MNDMRVVLQQFQCRVWPVLWSELHVLCAMHELCWSVQVHIVGMARSWCVQVRTYVRSWVPAAVRVGSILGPIAVLRSGRERRCDDA